MMGDESASASLPRSAAAEEAARAVVVHAVAAHPGEVGPLLVGAAVPRTEAARAVVVHAGAADAGEVRPLLVGAAVTADRAALVPGLAVAASPEAVLLASPGHAEARLPVAPRWKRRPHEGDLVHHVLELRTVERPVERQRDALLVDQGHRAAVLVVWPEVLKVEPCPGGAEELVAAGGVGARRPRAHGDVRVRAA